MTDFEISKALAFAIEWPQILTAHYEVMVRADNESDWRKFDFRDWAVISPIAERYNCFPMYWKREGQWWCWTGETWASADTPQEAIAGAVINRTKK